jgi:hypothetical protein
MTDSILRELAEQIVRDQILLNWRFYAILVAISVIAAVGSAFVVAYIRKRAETYATKADLSELLAQLKATTTAAEQVKTAIAHADWSNREWKSLRRTKLEELLSTVYDVRHWLDRDMSARFFNKATAEDRSPIWRLELISRLYFPELLLESHMLSLVYFEYTRWMLDVQFELHQCKEDLAKTKVVFVGQMDSLKANQQALLNAISAIEKKAPTIMQAIAGV